MAVRLRKWKTAQGEERRAWVVDYLDGRGKRRLKTFAVGKGQEEKARDFAAKTRVDIRKGVHVADSSSVTVTEAGRRWIERLEALGRERGTTDAYKGMLRNHIEPALGRFKLSQLDALLISDFEDALLRKANGSEGRGATKLSSNTVSKVMTALGSLLADAQARGLVGHNVVRERGRSNRHRRKHRLEVGRDIPSVDEVRAILSSAKPGLTRALLVTDIFTGLRASELRGLRWSDLELDRSLLHVRQRIDRWGKVGPPKSSAGFRSLPLPPMVVNTLKAWRLQCSSGEYVFVSQRGSSLSYTSLIQSHWLPSLKAAGLADRYRGFHSLRHFFASWCLNPLEAGGLGLSPKATQERLGHSSIVMTMDVYGHLFPSDDNSSALAEAERRLLG